MQPTATTGFAVALALVGAPAAFAQLTAASEGPIAYFTDPFGTDIELTEGLDNL